MWPFTLGRVTGFWLLARCLLVTALKICRTIEVWICFVPAFACYLLRTPFVFVTRYLSPFAWGCAYYGPTCLILSTTESFFFRIYHVFFCSKPSENWWAVGILTPCEMKTKACMFCIFRGGREDRHLWCDDGLPAGRWLSVRSNDSWCLTCSPAEK